MMMMMGLRVFVPLENTFSVKDRLLFLPRQVSQDTTTVAADDDHNSKGGESMLDNLPMACLCQELEVSSPNAIALLHTQTQVGF